MLWVEVQLCPSWQQHRLPACSSAAAPRRTSQLGSTWLRPKALQWGLPQVPQAQDKPQSERPSCLLGPYPQLPVCPTTAFPPCLYRLYAEVASQAYSQVTAAASSADKPHCRPGTEDASAETRSRTCRRADALINGHTACA